MESWHELERDDEYGDWLNLDEAEAAINALPAASLPAAWGREELREALYCVLQPRVGYPMATSVADELASIALSRPLPPFTDEMVERAANLISSIPLHDFDDYPIEGEAAIETARAILEAAWEAKPDPIEAEYVAAAVAWCEAFVSLDGRMDDPHVMDGAPFSVWVKAERAARDRFDAARAARGK